MPLLAAAVSTILSVPLLTQFSYRTTTPTLLRRLNSSLVNLPQILFCFCRNNGSLSGALWRIIHQNTPLQQALEQAGFSVSIEPVLEPAWTTDWITEEGKRKLEAYGIAPPVDEVDKSVLFSKPPVVPCPKCKETNTKLISQFGSTACKAHYQCQVCLEPFDYFKCLR
jgi:phenylacetate-CoA oxygenase PaaJ subunit